MNFLKTGTILLLGLCCGHANAATIVTQQVVSWKAILNASSPDQVQFQMRTSTGSQGDSLVSRQVSINTLEGLSATALNAKAMQPVTFDVRRDAGTFHCSGSASSGEGSGTCRYVANTAFAERLQTLGVGRPTTDEQYAMSILDVGYPLLDNLRSTGYPTPSSAWLVQAGLQGVNAAFVTDLAKLGYRLGSLDRLVQMRIQGVRADYIAQMNAAMGAKAPLPPDELLKLRRHGVKPGLVLRLREVGFEVPDVDGLVALASHRVTPEYVSYLASRGFKRLDGARLIELRERQGYMPKTNAPDSQR